VHRKVIMMALAIVGSFGCSASKGVGGATPDSVAVSAPSLKASDWDIQYSPGMPSHPSPAMDGGWYFDFPTLPGTSVNYVTTNYRSSGPRTFASMTIVVSTTGNPVFSYQLGDPGNICSTPAHVRLLLQRRDDDLTQEYYRWWSNAVSYELAATVDNPVTLTVAITPDQWTSVLGKQGDQDSDSLAGFRSAMNDLGRVGMTFGGGCYYGHGVEVSNGSARFTLLKYSIW
jgi:hypothetical protein